MTHTGIRRTLAPALTAVAAAALPASLAVAPSAAAAPAAAKRPAFVHGVLPPPPAGSTATHNQAAEPQIRADLSGRFYITSENGLGAGTDAWTSADGGRRYRSLPQPNGLSAASGPAGLAPGGGDTDLATAPVKNGSGAYNVYVASLTAAA